MTHTLYPRYNLSVEEKFWQFAIKSDPRRSAEGKPPCHGPFQSTLLHSPQGTLARLGWHTKHFGCMAHRSDHETRYEKSNLTLLKSLINIWCFTLLAYLVTRFTLYNLEGWSQLMEANRTLRTSDSPPTLFYLNEIEFQLQIQIQIQIQEQIQIHSGPVTTG